MRLALVVATLLATTATAPRGPMALGIERTPLEWLEVSPGLERASFEVQADASLWHTRVVAVRLDPAMFRFRLRGRVHDGAPDWHIGRAPADAVLAMNVGMYSGIAPWGWTVMDGQELRPPGVGPLSNALAWEAGGTLHWLSPDEIDRARSSRRITHAFQSYPMLLDPVGEVPEPLRVRGLGVDVDHRDGRLAIGQMDDGRLLVAMTRFYTLGESSPALPIGLTLGDMALVMRRLGCRRAVALDGGISAQLMVRDAGRPRTWQGWRRVPVGLIAEPRTP